MKLRLLAGTTLELGGKTVTLAADADFDTPFVSNDEATDYLHISGYENFLLNEPSLREIVQVDGAWFEQSYNGLNASKVLTPCDAPIDDETKVLDLGDGSSLPMTETPVDPEPEAAEEVVAPKTKGKK